MSFKQISGGLFTVMLLLVACTQEPDRLAGALEPQKLSRSWADVRVIGEEEVVGRSRLRRGENGVSMMLRTRKLEPHAAYTTWWVIFNHPEHCSGGVCGADDFAKLEVGASLLWATGSNANHRGRGIFAGYLRVKATDKARFGPGLTEPLGAEVHLVIRTHGQLIPGMMHEQLSTFDGGCLPNVCANVQASIHRP